MDEKKGYVYMLMNRLNTVVYVGVTSNLKRRVWEHKQGVVSSFTKRYKVKKLVYYEVFESVVEAIAREKQLKAGSRKKKDYLIEDFNPQRIDLYSKL